MPKLPDPLTEMLERAGRGKQPLAELLAAWMHTPAAELADAIASIPVDPALAEVVSGTAIDGLARLSRLPTDRDPRVAEALVEWLAKPPWHATGSQPFYKHVFERLAHQNDPRAIASLKRATTSLKRVVKGATMRGWLIDRITEARAALVERYPDGVPALTATQKKLAATAAKAAIAKPAPARVPSRRTDAAAELLAAIHADPRDDAARQVYADVLVEKSDPRGTFITMQLARAGRAPTAGEREAELELLSEHVQIWLGELASVTSMRAMDLDVGPHRGGALRFERGFLAGCSLGGPIKRLRAIAGNPMLSTVEELGLRSRFGPRTKADADAFATILRDTRFPVLRSLMTSPDLVDVVLAAPIKSQLERFACVGFPEEGHVRAATIPLKLRELGLSFYGGFFELLEERAVAAALKRDDIVEMTVTVGVRARFRRVKKTWELEVDGDDTVTGDALAALI